MAHATGNPQKHIQVKLGADTSHLSSNDRQVLRLLAEAVRLVNPIYLVQMNQDLETNNGHFDKTKGNNFYSEGVTHEELESFLVKHPDERDTLLSPFTVVDKVAGIFVATPYSEYYAEHLDQISMLLEEAARLTGNDSFRTFLLSKAQAFRTNKYRQSDIDWVLVSGAPLEITIGPYECYEDQLFGVKRDIQAMLGVVLQKETAEAQLYQEQVLNFDAHLGQKYGYTALTTLTPMIVMDEVLAGGRPLYGTVPMAYNLPNEPDIHKEVGSKKVFVRNVMRAKAELITMRVAERVLDSGLAAQLEPSIFMKHTIGHESSHGLSFKFGADNFLTLASPLEEGKADVFGMMFLYYLADKGIIARGVAELAVIGKLTDGLRQIRFGIEKAHAMGTLIQYNWFLEHGAMKFDGGGLVFVPELFEQTIESLGDALFALSQTQDHVAAQAFVDAWGYIPDEVRKMIEEFGDIPVDIDPIFEL